LQALFEEYRNIDGAVLTNVKIDQNAIPLLVSFARPRTANTQITIGSLKLSGVKLNVGNVAPPAFDATITLDANGAFQKAQIQNSKMSLEVTPAKEGAAVNVKFNGKGVQFSFGPALEYSFLTGTAVVEMHQAVFSNIDGRIANGSLTGGFNLGWTDKQFRAQGELSLKGADLAQLLPAYSRDFQSTGTLDITSKFSTQGAALEDLFNTPTATSTFTAGKGTINNIDLVRAIQSRSKQVQRGGRTAFNEITGEAQASAGRITLRNLKLVSGPMNGSGSIDVGANADISGRLELTLGSQSVTVARGNVNVGGNLKDPQLTQ
jgi:hypothetical protein